MNNYIKQYKDFIREKFIVTKVVEDEYDFFHISTTKLGKDFIFSARVPDMPFTDENGDIIEDNFTKRVSLATTIQGCLDAITDEEADGYYVYGVKKQEMDLKYLLDLSTIKSPGPDGYNYDSNFTLMDWCGYNNIEYKYSSPNDLPDNYKNKFFGLVPDCNITGEFWYLKDLKMKYLGEVIPWKYGVEKLISA